MCTCALFLFRIQILTDTMNWTSISAHENSSDRCIKTVIFFLMVLIFCYLPRFSYTFSNLTIFQAILNGIKRLKMEEDREWKEQKSQNKSKHKNNKFQNGSFFIFSYRFLCISSQSHSLCILLFGFLSICLKFPNELKENRKQTIQIRIVDENFFSHDFQ